MKKLVVEFIGTMFLVLAFGFTGNPLAIGIMLMVMVYMGGHISGGYYNPAVTVAIWLRGKLDLKGTVKYIIAQILGAFTAAFLYYIIKGSTFAPTPGTGIPAWKSILVEFIFTFALALIVLTVATAKKLEGNYIYGLAIGLTVTASAFTGGEISGGAFNPAVALGPMIMDVFQGGSSMANIFIYLIGPFVGGILSTYVFKYLNDE